MGAGWLRRRWLVRILLGDHREVVAQGGGVGCVRDVPLAVPSLEGKDQRAVPEQTSPDSLMKRHLRDTSIVQLVVAACQAVVVLVDLVIVQCPGRAQSRQEAAYAAYRDERHDYQSDAVDQNPQECRFTPEAEADHSDDATDDLDGVHQTGDATDEGEYALWNPGERVLGPLARDVFVGDRGHIDHPSLVGAGM